MMEISNLITYQISDQDSVSFNFYVKWFTESELISYFILFLKCVGKLADMYGEEPSDTDSNVDADEGWRIWRSNFFKNK